MFFPVACQLHSVACLWVFALARWELPSLLYEGSLLPLITRLKAEPPRLTQKALVSLSLFSIFLLWVGAKIYRFAAP